MGERKAWSKDEDVALLEIVQVRKIKKWSAVSKAMEDEFKIYGRTGKQCRQRWHNQLDPAIKNTEWTAEQQQILFQFHNKHGNRWARISQQLQGRTDNCVKNHFYSTLRKAFRRLNKFVADSRQKPGLKQLTPIMLSKLVAAAEDKFDRKLKLSQQIVQKSIQLKNRLIPFSKEEENTSEDQQEMETLIRELLAFCKSYKRKKSKKSKKDEDEEGDYYYEQHQDSVSGEPEKQETPASSTKQKPRAQYINLFSISTTQLITEDKSSKQACKEPVGVHPLQHKPQSKIIEQQNPFQTMIKKSSNMSTWSAGIFKIPSMHQRISNLSISGQFYFDSLGLENSLNVGHKNLFGVDFQHLDEER